MGISKNMNKNANPLEYVIQCCEHGLIPENFDINNAKDELKKIRQRIADLNQELINCEDDYQIVAWAKINDRGDLYDPRFCYNPHIDESYLIPLYCNEQEFKQKYGKLSK